MLMGNLASQGGRDGLRSSMQLLCQRGVRTGCCAQMVDFAGFLGWGAGRCRRAAALADATVSTQCRHSGAVGAAPCGKCGSEFAMWLRRATAFDPNRPPHRDEHHTMGAPSGV